MWAFANSNAIRRAVHARSTHEIGRFDECSDRITYTSDRGATMLPVHADLVSRGTSLHLQHVHIVCTAWPHISNLAVELQAFLLQLVGPHDRAITRDRGVAGRQLSSALLSAESLHVLQACVRSCTAAMWTCAYLSREPRPGRHLSSCRFCGLGANGTSKGRWRGSMSALRAWIT